ncbi:hypothetical protein BCR33DRAFT_711388 [Rhizoclosmatium globosum]|uniref:Uncharacterized protein n=1 Tax=Rhizoclosmatium globosum TaxID=329046 RepID=A0A1Y2D139_9FUNG|nr:hypothetical protein HDU79_002513 [Rhizoclosmatium sp. JEL0117]ORY52991.1 hypothetical protein BCR33DRAFT_711388 [Rhizoclosmatium globosum]|eukprot:ORY52991.1 hypothetical protein BCR33DRAFT_711388 [Rhizoclosmatium globosum]
MSAAPETIAAPAGVTPTGVLTDKNTLPLNWQTAEGLPQEPTINPLHNKTQTNTLRGTLTVYLIAISIWILINLIISFLGVAFVGAWIGIILAIFSLAINGLMFYAIQPDRLVPIWMDVFAYFYMVRAAIDIILTIWLAAVTFQFFAGIAVFSIIITGIEVAVIYFMVKHSFVYRAYALEVRKKLSGQAPTNVIAVETAVAAAV